MVRKTAVPDTASTQRRDARRAKTALRAAAAPATATRHTHTHDDDDDNNNNIIICIYYIIISLRTCAEIETVRFDIYICFTCTRA